MISTLFKKIIFAMALMKIYLHEIFSVLSKVGTRLEKPCAFKNEMLTSLFSPLFHMSLKWSLVPEVCIEVLQTE